MLKVNQIEFIDQNDQVYLINNYQIESFPLIGGAAANMVITKAWNQHGNTYVNNFMESVESDLIFVLNTLDRTPSEIQEMRMDVAKICNPLNGVVEMIITLNNGNVYHRDITFVSAPNFPIGFENRNYHWQKVQLQFQANNPFWYSDTTITETFQQAIPLFEFPFEMSDTTPIEFGTYLPNKTVINNGQVEAPVIIKIIGACINPIIENVTTGEMIRFKNLTMSATDELLIDTTFGSKKVILNKVQNVFDRLDFSTTFFHLKLGENIIDFRDDTLLTPEATIYFIYRNMYHTI
ncbi:phage tail family protein [Bacillus sp. ISL-75]|uniref:phage distal tail protein n=1 Tax=Bacillus sp. ISL-75 TaxID=2819137 RepID=UPI001BE566AC|nr:phage tail domain-containing protein [Bacillus sp. ISL-75]MBT2728400.1 phage tail family protein [Bacillus sp. ISL-75]